MDRHNLLHQSKSEDPLCHSSGCTYVDASDVINRAVEALIFITRCIDFCVMR